MNDTRRVPANAGATHGRWHRASSGWSIPWSLPAILTFLVMLGLAFITPLGSKGALLFLASGMLLVLSSPAVTFSGLRQNWVVVAMALWCLVSFTWSDYPELSLRYGVQLCITITIAIAIFERVPPGTFVKITFIVYSLANIGSLLSGRTRADGGGFLGLYNSKNALAGAGAMAVVLSIAVLWDRRLSWRWRGPALVMVVVGTMLMLMGKSTGALAGMVGVAMAFALLLLLQRLPPMTRLVGIALGVILLAFGTVLAITLADQIADMMLQATGKDVTLTGRTDLWRMALREIARRPWLGAGYQAVWVQGNPLAEELWAMFGIDARAGFHFHNTLLSNAVEIGIIGAGLQAAVFFRGLYLSLAWVVRRPSVASIFFALFMIRQFLAMGLEVVFFFQFEPITIITLAALHYGREFRHVSQAHDAASVRNAAAHRRRTMLT